MSMSLYEILVLYNTMVSYFFYKKKFFWMYFAFIHSYNYRGFCMLGITYITMSKFWSLANASLLLLQKLLQFRKKVFAGKRRISVPQGNWEKKKQNIINNS